MKKNLENIGWTLLGIFMIILVIFGILIWGGMIFVWITESYEKNPNLLFILIPVLIIIHIWGYLCFTKTRI